MLQKISLFYCNVAKFDTIGVCTMRQTDRSKKLITVILFLFAASSLIYLQSCGKTGRSGGCTSGTAPDGAGIVAPLTLGAPYVFRNSCYPALGFTVKDSTGIPLNNICVEIYSDASIALHSDVPDCGNVAANPQSSIITRTDDHGVVSVELLTGPTPTGTTHFVEVVSGGISAIAVTAAAVQ